MPCLVCTRSGCVFVKYNIYFLILTYIVLGFGITQVALKTDKLKFDIIVIVNTLQVKI